MESEQLYHRGYCRNSYNSIASASSDEELLDGAGVIMDFHTTEDDNLLDGDAASPGREYGIPPPRVHLRGPAALVVTHPTANVKTHQSEHKRGRSSNAVRL
ncbi:H(+)/Cl(-) exchange transporter 3 [Collichthys lucidus]|uniref:H(+)/Cl(-) exchange transporter 3 n=1 Tax=Collichthys lucidus TaxID=240159 RepID=A0A4V6ATP3_COLLU|nr:H(+)/Cl(-) exchange transporter 3 [Collichthys lucidus]